MADIDIMDEDTAPNVSFSEVHPDLYQAVIESNVGRVEDLLCDASDDDISALLHVADKQADAWRDDHDVQRMYAPEFIRMKRRESLSVKKIITDRFEKCDAHNGYAITMYWGEGGRRSEP